MNQDKATHDSITTYFLYYHLLNLKFEKNEFQVLLHSPGDVPRLAKSYFRIPFNKVVTAAITPGLIKISSSIKSLSAEQRHCYLKSERPLQHFKIYSQSNCLLECFANYTLKKCGCVSYFMPSKYL
jgi:amiloride-sensitive sodium channel